jgi:hypothetical protein
MRRFLITPVAGIFFFCLLFVFPSKASANITSGNYSCAGGKIVQMPNGGVGCIIPVKVRPPGKGGGGGSTADWGMCGVLSVSAYFGALSQARIIVDTSGYYAVELVGNKPSEIPTLSMSCVLFSDFTSVPPVSDGTSFDPPPYDGGGSQDIAGSKKNACIWAGLSGNVEPYDSANQGASGEAFAQYSATGPDETLIGASPGKTVTSYAFCSGYSAASWTGWSYFRHGFSFSAPPAHPISIGMTTAHDWCYMDGIETNLLYPNYEEGPISGGLKLLGGAYSMFATATPAGSPPGGVLVDYNCLPLHQ